MNGYALQDPATLVSLGVMLTVVALSAFGISRLRYLPIARTAGWLLVISAGVLAERLTASEPAGVRMLAIVLSLLLSLKGLVSVEEQRAGRPRLKPLSWFLFATCWPGMRPSTFSDVPGPPRRRWGHVLRWGLINLLIGAMLMLLAWWVMHGESGSEPSVPQLAAGTVLLLPAISFVLHFGLFNVLAGVWRRFGGDCHALFRAPAKSTSLTEFWGRRWNLAFSEMTALVIFRPLRGLIGVRTATIAAFLFSGLLHELAISVPARAGYGLPMLYFVLHALAMQIEAALADRNHPIDAVPWLGRLWTAAWIILPLPILFHLPFLRGCVWPLVGVVVDG